jgi:hypothetical protein
MAATLKTIKATVEADGTVHLAQPIEVNGPVQAVVTLLIDEDLVKDDDEPTPEELEAMLEAEADRKAGRSEAFTDLEDLKTELSL